MTKTKQTLLVLTASLASLLPAQDITTGSGEHEFTIHPDISDTSKIDKFGPTHGGIAISKKTGHLYVSTDSGQGIAIFTKEGVFQKFIAPDCSHLHSIHLHVHNGEEHLVAAQGPKKRAILLKLDGTLVQEITTTTAGLADTALNGITAATIAPDGSWFTANGYGDNLIHKFDASGKHLLSFGGRGGKLEQFHTCHGMRIDTRFGTPLLLVADRENGQLKHFTLDGKFHGIHTHGLRRPCAIDFHGDLVATAELAGRGTIINKSGHPIAFLGDNPDVKQRANFGVPPAQWNPAYFTAPHGLSYTPEGNIWVQDWNIKGRLHFLKKK